MSFADLLCAVENYKQILCLKQVKYVLTTSSQHGRMLYPTFAAGRASRVDPDRNLLRVRAQHVPALLPALSLHYRVTESYYMAPPGILIGFSQ